MKDEDKPEQEVAKLDVADAVPIKHESHASAGSQQQEQQPADSGQVRMTTAGAEADPLQCGHPANLEASTHLFRPDDSQPAPLDAFAKSQKEHMSELPEHQTADGLLNTVVGGLAHGVTNGQLQQPSEGGVPSAGFTVKGTLPMTDGRGHQYLQNGLQADTPMKDANAVNMGTASAVKDEDVQQASGVGFLEADSPMLEVDVMDPLNSYVKVETGALAGQASGISGIDGTQAAVMMDVDQNHRHASPAAQDHPSDIGNPAAQWIDHQHHDKRISSKLGVCCSCYNHLCGTSQNEVHLLQDLYKLASISCPARLAIMRLVSCCMKPCSKTAEMPNDANFYTRERGICFPHS